MTALTLTVTAFNGQPADGSLAAQFDELGGLIGRADTNQLVLPDPERSISRVHAQVVYRNSGYVLVDRGSNPVTVNGKTAGVDREIALGDGDRVQIGGYELRVALRAAGAASSKGGGAAADDPFADLLGAAPARPAAGRGAALPDPLKSPPATPSDPFAAFAAPATAGRAGPAATHKAGIPDDWDPFAADAASSAPPARAAAPARRDALGLDIGAAAPEPLVSGLPGATSGGGGSDSLDALFGLKAGAAGDPFAQSALGEPMAKPNMAGHADPLKALGSAPRASAATESDALSDLQRPFVAAPAPLSKPTPTPTPPPVPAPSPEAAAAVAPQAKPVAGAMLSWDDAPNDGGMTVIHPGKAAGPARALPGSPGTAPAGESSGSAPSAPRATETGAAPAARPSAASSSASVAADWPASAPVAAPPAATPSPVAAPLSQPDEALAATADVQALAAAFREGLDAPDVRFDGLTPDLMRLVGGLLREAAAGTVAMLQARAALKRELQAEMTMIATKQNNPLKFSPSAEVALQHLLAPPARGFMAAAPAMQDAYADLCAHQFGMVAGMRAALEGVLGRFDPAQLEGRLEQRSLLRNLLPGSRKAQLWELFVEHYGQIRGEAADDFQKLFGQAFLRAYEEHIDRLDRAGQS